MYLDRVKKTLYDAIGDLLQQESTSRMRSRTLRQELTIELDLGGSPGLPDRIVLSLPYYWAEYAHDGRGEINMPPGKYLIFFPDHKDDPRTDGGTSYPRRRGDQRALSDYEYKEFSHENRVRKANGQPPIMVVTRHVGPAEGEFFFKLAWEYLVSSGVVASLTAASLEHYLKSLSRGLDRERVAVDL